MSTPRYYTRELLQAEADRWSGKLKARGFVLPESRIEVLTSWRQFVEATGRSVPSRLPDHLDGAALKSTAGLPIVYVRLIRRDEEGDPLKLLIHELLHHVRPELDHLDIYALSADLRRTDEDALVPFDYWATDPDSDDWELPPLTVRSYQQALDFIDKLYMDVNGFRSLPPRSPLTGRFVKASVER